MGSFTSNKGVTTVSCSYMTEFITFGEEWLDREDFDCLLDQITAITMGWTDR